MLNFLLASSNAHKAEEFSKLFSGDLVQVSSAPRSLEVVEDGDSFQENALKKAKAYWDAFGQPILADDSGLCVEAIPDELGILSARFGGNGLTDRDRAELLIKKMENNLTSDQRKAYFVCHLCCYLNPSEIFFFEGRLQGEIGFAYLGEHGFGYDPVFVPRAFVEDDSRKTLAQLPEWKQEFSHRAVAVQLAEQFFKERRGQKV